MRKVISSAKAPKATGPFSQAILTDAKYRMELSGQVGINPQTGKLVDGGISAEAEQVLENVKSILAEAGWDFSNVVKARIFITDMNDYHVVNAIYAKSFQDNPPARVAVAVKQLPLGALVEIECEAAGDEVK